MVLTDVNVLVGTDAAAVHDDTLCANQRRGFDNLRQRCQVQRPVAGIDQAHPGQKQHRAQQSDQQIAQRRPHGSGAARERCQCDGAQPQQLQGHVEIEQVAGQQQSVQCGP